MSKIHIEKEDDEHYIMSYFIDNQFIMKIRFIYEVTGEMFITHIIEQHVYDEFKTDDLDEYGEDFYQYKENMTHIYDWQEIQYDYQWYIDIDDCDDIQKIKNAILANNITNRLIQEFKQLDKDTQTGLLMFSINNDKIETVKLFIRLIGDYNNIKIYALQRAILMEKYKIINYLINNNSLKTEIQESHLVLSDTDLLTIKSEFNKKSKQFKQLLHIEKNPKNKESFIMSAIRSMSAINPIDRALNKFIVHRTNLYKVSPTIKSKLLQTINYVDNNTNLIIIGEEMGVLENKSDFMKMDLGSQKKLLINWVNIIMK